jgi:internalin A
MRRFYRLFLVCLFLASSADARSFQSSLNLKLFEFGFNVKADTPLGFTDARSRHTVDVPFGDTWYVRPVGSFKEGDFERLAAEVKAKRVPGIDLSNRWDVTNESLAVLADNPSLRLLLLAHTRVGDAGMIHVGKYPGIKYLALDQQITDKGLLPLQNARTLEYIYLHRSKITDQGLAYLKGLPKLETLDVGGTPITNAGAKSIGMMTSLKHLDISDTGITDAGLPALSGLTRLETLYANQRITNVGLKQLLVFKKLKILDLSGAPITNAGAATIANIQDLEELALSGTKIDDAALKQLSQLKRLKALELSFTGVTSRGLAHLAGMKRLNTLSLSWGKLTEADLRMLAELPSIKTVVLNGEVVEPEVLARITALAKANALHHRSELGTTKSLAGVAPTAHPGGKGGVAVQPVKSSRDKAASIHTTPSKQATLPPDLEPTLPVAIALDTRPQGKPIEIEINARRSSGNRRGLQRIHYMDAAPSRDLEILPGGNKTIRSPEETATSLGNIEVGTR